MEVEFRGVRLLLYLQSFALSSSASIAGTCWLHPRALGLGNNWGSGFFDQVIWAEEPVEIPERGRKGFGCAEEKPWLRHDVHERRAETHHKARFSARSGEKLPISRLQSMTTSGEGCKRCRGHNSQKGCSFMFQKDMDP